MLPFPHKQYSVILADPPWAFSRGEHAGSMLHQTHYPRMTLPDICEIPVRDITETNSVLFLWHPGAFTPDAIEVCQSWGFHFVTEAFVWLKENANGGFFCGLGGATRNAAEFCLLGRKGLGLPRLDRGVRQIVIAPRRKHSQKPAEVRDRIVRLYGDVPRIELFARQQTPGWDSWGLDVPGGVYLTPPSPPGPPAR